MEFMTKSRALIEEKFLDLYNCVIINGKTNIINKDVQLFLQGSKDVIPYARALKNRMHRSSIKCLIIGNGCVNLKKLFFFLW